MLTHPKGQLEEFSAELSDHSYGVRSFTAPTTSTGGNTAESTIALLEDGQSVVVSFGEAGYTVVEGSGHGLAGERFESLTALLMRASAGFARAMHSRLFDRLEAIAREQA